MAACCSLQFQIPSGLLKVRDIIVKPRQSPAASFVALYTWKKKKGRSRACPGEAMLRIRCNLSEKMSGRASR